MSFLQGYARKLGVAEYLGTWNASTNTPALTSSSGQRSGYYIVSTAGTTTLDGISQWDVGDWAIFNGSVWQKIDTAESEKEEINSLTTAFEDHSARHSPNGADPLSTAAPVATGLTNAEGASNSFARADHVHQTVVSPYFTFVSSKSDFPAAVNGVITLEANKTYFITSTIDLTGDRLVGSQNTTIIGGSSENCFLISTGLSASTALLSSAWSIPMRSLSISHGTAINLDATGNANQAIDWFGVNFTNCATVGLVKSYSNFIMTDCALLNSANFTFDGTIGTVGFDQCLFSGIAGQTTLNFPSTLTITRRIRVIYSSFVAFGGATAINVDTAAVIPVESYILDTINFSGGATYIAGVQHNDNKSLFVNCKNINNTAEVGQMYFINNATQNPIATVSVFEKIEGTTSPSAENEKFSHSIGRLTYTGGITREFVVTASCSANSVVTNTVTITVRIAKNGVTIAESESQATTSASARNENFYCQALATLAQNDYIELFIANQTNANSLLVTELNVLVRSAE